MSKNKFEKSKSYLSGHIVQDLHKHSKWKKRWKEFVKYDMDWDFLFLIDLNLKKLTLMQDYFRKHAFLEEKRIESIVEEMEEVIQIGKKIREEDYSKNSYEFMSKHTYHGMGMSTGLIGDDGKINKEIRKLEEQTIVYLPKTNSEREYSSQEYEELKQLVLNKANELGIPEDQRHGFFYCGKWDNEENRKIYHKMAEEEYKNYKKQVKQFFSLIGKYCLGWWD